MIRAGRLWCHVLIVGLAVSQARAGTIYVPSRDIDTIQDGIDAANPGDTVVVAPGIYYENIDLKGKAITVRSSGPDDPEVVAKTVIDGGGNGAVVTFGSGEGPECILEGFAITNGVGAPIFYPGGPGARAGGGIFCALGSAPTIRYNHIHHNQANTMGAGVYCEGDVTLEHNRITDNSGTQFGGGVYWAGAVGAILDNVVSSNTALAGGGLYLVGSPTIQSNQFLTNTATGPGGGIYCLGGAAWIGNNLIESNTAVTGGGLYCNGGDPVVTNNVIYLNTASGDGGGLWTDQESPISGNRITANLAANGGGIYIVDPLPSRTGSTVLIGNTISGNSALGDGAGIYCSAGYTGTNVEIRSSLLAVNHASGRGGGVYCNGKSPDIISCTLSGNGAVGGGGGIECTVTTGPTISLPHVYNTIVAFSSIGGGIRAEPSAAAYLHYCNAYGNAGGDYSGLVFYEADTISQDPLFANPATGDYHLKSRGGRWIPGGWAYDTLHSPSIDTGDPAADYANEPSPNGGRLNMGVYGNTAQASKALPAALTVTGIAPDTGTSGGSVAITDLAGTGFLPGAEVVLRTAGQPDVAGQDVVLVGPEQLTCTFNLAGAAIGPRDVVVTNLNGMVATLPDGFTIAYPPPQITSILPDHGLTSDAACGVVITGQDFYAEATVALMLAGQPGIAATDVQVVDATHIQCTLDLTGSQAGSWDVMVVNPDDQFATLPSGFAITYPPPQVTGILPDHGLASDAACGVAITGQGFYAGATVTLRLADQPDIAATDVQVVDPTRIQCTLDLTGKQVGSWDVVLVNPDDQLATLPAAFEIKERVPGDVNGDQNLDAMDLAAFMREWRLYHVADPGWDRAADQDADGDLDATDADLLLMLLAAAGAL